MTRTQRELLDEFMSRADRLVKRIIYTAFAVAEQSYHEQVDPAHVVVVILGNTTECLHYRRTLREEGYEYNALVDHINDTYYQWCEGNAPEQLTPDARKMFERAIELADGRGLTHKIHPSDLIWVIKEITKNGGNKALTSYKQRLARAS